jgi:GT2 family glycosyltransferase
MPETISGAMSTHCTTREAALSLAGEEGRGILANVFWPNLPGMDVSVIIVTYQSASCIGDCLDAVLAQQGIDAEVVVVDNGSTDGTLDEARRLKAKQLRIIANTENLGFGKGCNQAFAGSQGKFIYLLNPDALLVEPDALVRLCQALDAHPEWGLAGTTLVGTDGTLAPAPETTYPGQLRAANDFATLPGKIAWVLGASMFVRRNVYDVLCGFDLDFFLYSEEIDFCLRLRKQGYEIGYVADVQVRHIGGASEDGRDPYEVWTRRTKGLHLFWSKHYASEDVARLVEFDAARARRRMRLNSLLARLLPAKSKPWQKMRRYQGIYETSLKFLSETAAESSGQESVA